MINCNLMGGLGNQLFQIFTTISYAMKTKNEYKFLNVKTLQGISQRYTFWDSFLKKLKPFLIGKLPEMLLVKEEGFEFKELPVSLLKNRDVCIHGYFQSYKYIQEHFLVICKLLDIHTMRKEVLQKHNIKNEDLKNTISMHFRLGDYKQLTHFHPIQPVEYYINALKYIQKKYNSSLKVLYFCEEEDFDTVEGMIIKCRNIFPDFIFERVSNYMEDWEQMLFMSQCDHHIIANSSFSWWGAYLGFQLNKINNLEKIVCYPSLWFAPSANIKTTDLCPTEWVNIL